ncbi:MAG TPA: 6-phosphogluconate dehydrogenase (decarboxylating), partial [Candidatus Kurthia intestinigallinarum]|nr:6-phosphogluconate dehydrogenase (decarboxylating) [Candidatus Kurthia intestinigallinarum]
MNIGLVGLGKMGFNLAENLMDHKHTVTAFDVNQEAGEKFTAVG